MADQAEILIAINAADIEKNKVRHDLGITYDEDVLRLIQEFRDKGSMWEALSSPSTAARAAPTSSKPSWSTVTSKYTAITVSKATPAMCPSLSATKATARTITLRPPAPW